MRCPFCRVSLVSGFGLVCPKCGYRHIVMNIKFKIPTIWNPGGRNGRKTRTKTKRKGKKKN